MKYWQISKFNGNTLVPDVHSRNKTLNITVKFYAKTDIKGFWSCPILLGFFTSLYVVKGYTLSTVKKELLFCIIL